MSLMILTSVLLLICTCSAGLPSCWWSTPNQTMTVWSQNTRITTAGPCAWNLQEDNLNLELRLFTDFSYQDELRMTLYLAQSINSDYFYYSGTAHASYEYYHKLSLTSSDPR